MILPAPFASDARGRALLVMARSTGRVEARRALREVGLQVQTRSEPYGAVRAFAQRPAELIVLSLGGLGLPDTTFVRMLRRNHPYVRILLLVPDGTRELAVEAISAGADAYVLAPFYRRELSQIASRLLVGPAPFAPTPTDPPVEAAAETVEHAAEPDPASPSATAAPATAALASEVAHAVNNPLQVLALLSETGGEDDRDEEVAGRMRVEVERVRQVTEILGRYGHRSEPSPALGPVGALFRERLAVAESAGLVAPEIPEDDDPACVFDPRQLSQALDDVITVLAAHGKRTPVRLRARVVAETDQVALTLKASGVRLSRDLQSQLLTQVVWSHEDTRVPYPGLAFAKAVCEAHGGALGLRGIRGGAEITLRLPARAG